MRRSCLNARWVTPADDAAATRRVSRSSSDPGRTSTPAACRALAEASERASPTTSWPAAVSSGTTARPIQPDAPVTKTRMRNLRDAGARRVDSLRTTLMSVAVITIAHPLSVTVITYDRTMNRWKPDARGRLAQAALEVYG